ncbi:hypothetical protein EW145_g4149 [Phellinidium pouzarii]|uniref:Glycerol-3-phosphate dehydrogenase [NAD(+)] n=1 Tax=Phellinidium pouzarii TaxID=167371 RepID=A0A4S4L4S0_9AGAM|nr:hypothetical protein EW145_g4149 [Phellinidium pouzarii]
MSESRRSPQPPTIKNRVCILGAGNFGSCLADHLGDSEHDVLLWSRSERQVMYFNAHHKNSEYFKDHVFPPTIIAIGPELPSAEVIKRLDVLLFAIPTEALRATLTALRPRLDNESLPLLIFVNKGIEISTGALTLEIISDTCGAEVAKVATFISGPSFAKETSLSQVHAERASRLFHKPWFRCYTGNDPIGIELAGALKNVYAIATGMSDGLGFEDNTRAMLITRGLAEMTRIGSAYGASPLTFLSLAGVGDLFLTCSSPTSRNYTVGFRLGRGETLDEIMRTLGSVAEGVSTARALKKIIDELGVSAPIASGIYEVLYEGKDVKERAEWLMEHPAMMELELPERRADGPDVFFHPVSLLPSQTIYQSMVSPLWVASDEGDFAQVQFILKEASPIDIEIKDDAGATPLVQAVKNGHGHVVRLLLDAGADPSVSSSHGSLEQLTADATILELVNSAREKRAQAEQAVPTYVPPEGYSQEYVADPAKAYYAQPHGSYMYYPPYHPGAALLPDGTPAPYYPPPQLAPTAQSPDGAGGSNLPPPEIARLIPCRWAAPFHLRIVDLKLISYLFFFLLEDIFLPVVTGLRYPAPYDPMAQAPYGGYYAVTQSQYPPNGMTPVANPMSPSPTQSSAMPPNHVGGNSEVMSPTQPPFSPSGGPPPGPYGPPMSAVYPQPQQGHAPLQPIPGMPISQQPSIPSVQPNGVMYSPTSPVVQQSAMHRRDPSMVNHHNAVPPQMPAADGRGPTHAQANPPQQDAYMNRPSPRDGANHARRGSVRRLSGMGPSRKPPCAFFPSGRCRNGESCRFPHIMPDGDSGSGHFNPKFGPRGRAHPPPASEQLHEKMAALSTRSSFYLFLRTLDQHLLSPGAQPLGGPTAAQVLQAPPPTRKDSMKSVNPAHNGKNGDVSPEQSVAAEEDAPSKGMNGGPNGHHVNGINGINGSARSSAHDLKPLSFAAAATVAVTTPESAGTVSVSA